MNPDHPVHSSIKNQDSQPQFIQGFKAKPLNPTLNKTYRTPTTIKKGPKIDQKD